MLLLEIKSFVSLKNESLLLWTRVHFKGGGSQFLENFEGFAHKGGGGGGGGGGGEGGGIFFFGGGGLTGLEFFFLRGGGKIKRADVNISGWG